MIREREKEGRKGKQEKRRGEKRRGETERKGKKKAIEDERINAMRQMEARLISLRDKVIIFVKILNPLRPVLQSILEKNYTN